MVVPKLEYEEVWEGNAKFVKQLETVQMTAAKNIIGCSSTTSDTVLRAELLIGMYPIQTNRDVRKFKWQYQVKNMPEKRLPAIVDRTVYVVERIWKDLGGGGMKGTVYREVWRVQDRSKRNNRREGKAGVRKYGESREAFRGRWGVEGRYWNEIVSARPNGLREKAETAISCRGPGPTRK